jgi:hypothetical protein
VVERRAAAAVPRRHQRQVRSWDPIDDDGGQASLIRGKPLSGMPDLRVV